MPPVAPVGGAVLSGENREGGTFAFRQPFVRGGGQSGGQLMIYRAPVAQLTKGQPPPSVCKLGPGCCSALARLEPEGPPGSLWNVLRDRMAE